MIGREDPSTHSLHSYHITVKDIRYQDIRARGKLFFHKHRGKHSVVKYPVERRREDRKRKEKGRENVKKWKMRKMGAGEMS